VTQNEFEIARIVWTRKAFVGYPRDDGERRTGYCIERNDSIDQTEAIPQASRASIVACISAPMG
jgi:hypothetical protein